MYMKTKAEKATYWANAYKTMKIDNMRKKDHIHTTHRSDQTQVLNVGGDGKFKR